MKDTVWIDNYTVKRPAALRRLTREEVRELNKWRNSYKRRVKIALRDVYGDGQ